MLTVRILEILWKVILHEANDPDRKRLDVIFKLYKMSVIIKLITVMFDWAPNFKVDMCLVWNKRPLSRLVHEHPGHSTE